jgi:hypothetical protein
MNIETDKIDIWVYMVIFVFVLVPFAWGKIKTAKQTIREMLDIHTVDKKLEAINEKLDNFTKLEQTILEIIKKKEDNGGK